MVDREFDLGRQGQQRGQDYELPRQRINETPPQQTGIPDEELRTFFPRGRYEFERIPLDITGRGIEEVGIHRSGERVEAYQLDSSGKRVALRGVLTGYQGIFGREADQQKVHIDLVGTMVGDEMGIELFTSISDFNMYRYAQRVARRKIPISVAFESSGETLLLSRTPGGLLWDIRRLEQQLGAFSFSDKRSLNRARAVAEHVKANFKTERPSNQPGRARVKGQ